MSLELTIIQNSIININKELKELESKDLSLSKIKRMVLTEQINILVEVHEKIKSLEKQS